MTNITTLDILKILPFEKEFKDNLLDNFEKLTLDQQNAMEDIIWETYDALCKMKLEENLELAFQRAKNNQEKLDEDFYARIKEQTEKEIMENFNTSLDSAELTDAREELEKIMKQNTQGS